ncbi:MAG TPA: bile acid:sodium symporter [Gemmataceae bacterium]|nr:bile acid:sodium symporter [Gemmataceae bacterium]
MGTKHNILDRIQEMVHRRLLWATLVAYTIAAFVPRPGIWIRHASLGRSDLFGIQVNPSFPSLLLAVLLFNAGLGVQTGRLRALLRAPVVLLAGLLANLLVPLLFVLGMAQMLRLWHNPVEVQCILLGLGIVASMPVAGSSAAWSQNSNGDLALSLSLVIFSTCLSPFTTPLVLKSVGFMTSGEYAASLHDLSGGTSVFLLVFVMLPSLLGIGLRAMVADARWRKLSSLVKLITALDLLVLCYSNATAALPQTVANPDWDFLAVMLAIVVTLCAIGFASGWAIARLLGTDRRQRAALMFGLGMNNNGTGLVLAGSALAHLPSVMLPVIFYNLVQHVAAAITGHWASRKLLETRSAV